MILDEVAFHLGPPGRGGRTFAFDDANRGIDGFAAEVFRFPE